MKDPMDNMGVILLVILGFALIVGGVAAWNQERMDERNHRHKMELLNTCISRGAIDGPCCAEVEAR